MWYAEMFWAVLHVNILTFKPIQTNLQYEPSNSSLGDGSFGGGFFEDVHLLASVAVVVLAMVVVILRIDNTDL